MEWRNTGNAAPDLNQHVTTCLRSSSISQPCAVGEGTAEVGQVGIWEEALVIIELLISQELLLPLLFVCV